MESISRTLKIRKKIKLCKNPNTGRNLNSHGKVVDTLKSKFLAHLVGGFKTGR
jgi:hypothetical protein